MKWLIEFWLNFVWNSTNIQPSYFILHMIHACLFNKYYMSVSTADMFDCFVLNYNWNAIIVQLKMQLNIHSQPRLCMYIWFARHIYNIGFECISNCLFNWTMFVFQLHFKTKQSNMLVVDTIIYYLLNKHECIICSIQYAGWILVEFSIKTQPKFNQHIKLLCVCSIALCLFCVGFITLYLNHM